MSAPLIPLSERFWKSVDKSEDLPSLYIEPLRGKDLRLLVSSRRSLSRRRAAGMGELMTLLRCEARNCRAVTDSAQQGRLLPDGWRIERVGDEMIVVCPAHNWRADGTLVGAM